MISVFKGWFGNEKKYWKERKADWMQAYGSLTKHPHRDTLIKILGRIRLDSVLELGCNCGPNLKRIKEEWPQTILAGTDINEEAIKTGRKWLPDADLRIRDFDSLDFPDKSFDIVLTDACLIYLGRKEITKAAKEMARLARKAIVMVEWHSNWASGKGNKFFGHWLRDYRKLFKEHDVNLIKITNWGGEWNRFGHIIVVKL